jgi:ubiquitin-protein ligase
MSATQKMLGKEKPCPNCKKNFCVQEKKTTVTPPLNQPESERISSIPSTNKIVISFDDIVPASAHSDWVVVPSDVIPKQPNVKKLSPRQRRLNADFETVTKGLLKSRFIKIQRTEGTPPEVYYIEYNVRGIEAVRGGQIQYRNQHLLKIQLTSGYPREQPKCQLLTPIFHPNFEPAVICIGDHWTAQERLIDLVIRIGEMIAYQSYNIKSPLDGEAAMWADQHENLMPIDKTDLMPPE